MESSCGNYLVVGRLPGMRVIAPVVGNGLYKCANQIGRKKLTTTKFGSAGFSGGRTMNPDTFVTLTFTSS
jgi:hypothetical protein